VPSTRCSLLPSFVAVISFAHGPGAISSMHRTPETNKENVKSRVRCIQLQRHGRVPLSPSKAPPVVTPKIDNLIEDFNALSVSLTKTRSTPALNSRDRLAAPPTTVVSTPSDDVQSNNRRLKSLSTSASTSASTQKKSGESSSRSSSRASSRKPIDDYRSPVQILTREPDWDALAPQAQHGMLGLHGDLPMNLTGVVKNDWQGYKVVVSEATMAQARELSRSNNIVELPKAKNEGDDVDSGIHAKLAPDDGTVRD
jgi:hypothetical protein